MKRQLEVIEMSNKRMYVGSAGLIAVAIFIYLGFFATNPTGEDVSGTINTVQKYQTDQISDADVVLAGEEGIIDELAELVDHATIEEKSEMLGKASAEMTVSMMGRADKKFLADLWGQMEKADQVASFNAMTTGKEAVLGRTGMTMATFNRLDVEKMALALQGASVEEKVEMFNRTPNKARLAALQRMDMQGRAHLLQGATIRERAMLARNATPATREAILGRMDLQGRMNLVKTASEHGRVAMFNRAAEIDQFSMMQGATISEMVALYGRLDLQDQINGAMERIQATREIGDLGRASNVEAENVFALASPKLAVELYGRLDKAKKDLVLGHMSLTSEDFGKMSLEKKAEALQEAKPQAKVEMLGKAEFQEAFDLMGRMKLADWKGYLGRLDDNARADSWGRVDKKIQMTALGRSPEIKAAFMARASAKTVDNVLGRAFLDNPTVK